MIARVHYTRTRHRADRGSLTIYDLESAKDFAVALSASPLFDDVLMTVDEEREVDFR